MNRATPHAFIELSNKNLFANFAGNRFDKFSNIGGSNLTGVWQDSGGEKIFLSNNKILKYYNESNLPMNFIIPTLFTVKFDNGLREGTVSADGTNITWRRNGSNDGSWKKISDVIGTTNIKGIWQDGAGEHIIIKTNDQIDQYYNQSDLPITAFTPTIFSVTFDDNNGTMEGNLSIDGKRIDWYKEEVKKSLDAYGKAIYTKVRSFMGSWTKIADVATIIDSDNTGNIFVAPKPNKTELLNQNAPTEVNMPVGADPYQIPLPPNMEKPGMENNNSTSPNLFGYNLNIKRVVITGVLLLGALAFWKGGALVQKLKQ